MDRSFYGRCHPDNIWALCGLAGCLKYKLDHPPTHNYLHLHSHEQPHHEVINLQHQHQHEQQQSPESIRREYDEVMAKIAAIRSKNGENDSHINVSCMCVRKSEID